MDDEPLYQDRRRSLKDTRQELSRLVVEDPQDFRIGPEKRQRSRCSLLWAPEQTLLLGHASFQIHFHSHTRNRPCRETGKRSHRTDFLSKHANLPKSLEQAVALPRRNWAAPPIPNAYLAATCKCLPLTRSPMFS